MKIRERALAFSVGGFVVLMVLYTVLSTVLLGPLRTHRQAYSKALDDYNDYHQRNGKRADFQKRLNALALQAYDQNADSAARQLRIRLLELAKASKLNESELLLQETERVTERANSIEYFTEVGWHVTCVGPLKELTDFLYLLKSEPRLIRIDKLGMQPKDDRAVKASFLCTTLVLGPMKGWTPAAPGVQATQPATVQLASPPRVRYDAIASRDLFRPYIPRPPVAPRPDMPPQPPPMPPVPSGPDYNRYRVAGLSEFGTEGELPVLLVDQTAQTGQQYGIGQTVLDLKIVMVDYRPQPTADQPDILSPSRLILQQEEAFWAVELGQSLSQKRRLNDEELPPGLVTTPASNPAGDEPAAIPTQPAAETGDTTTSESSNLPPEQSEDPAKQSGTLPHDES